MSRTNLTSPKYFLSMLGIITAAGYFASCTHEDQVFTPPSLETPSQVSAQVAYDATDVAFRFTWKSQKKLYPSGMPSAGKNYPMQFHDMLKHTGTKFDRLPEGQRLEEDRISIMFDQQVGGIQGFSAAGCAITCHSGMGSHNLATDDILDHWHWRGGRSGPMGYAEDVAVNNTERIRDNLGTMPTKFLRSGGDRLRENQAALSGSGHPVLTDGFPRFVFNKGKSMPGNFTIPAFFIANEANTVISNPHVDIPAIKDVSQNRSLLVVYQDKNFDTQDKLNALDLGYLVYVALGSVGHLPTQLRDESSNDFNTWKSFWATESKITAAPAALTKLNEVHAEWVSSQKMAMVTRSVGFIYNSDQHDITSERFYDESKNEWTVIMKRKFSTGSERDEDLAGLRNGSKYTISFAMHDSGAGSETHDISIPYTFSNTTETDIQAISVGRIQNADWNSIPALQTNWVKQALMPKYTSDWLKSGAHPGSGSLESTTCGTCHTGNQSLLNASILD